MSVHEYRAAVRAGMGPELEEVLTEEGEAGWMLIEDPIAGSTILAGYFETADSAREAWSALAGKVDGFLEDAEPVMRELPDQDWRLSYRDHFKAWHSGPVHWVPVWERDSYEVPAGDVVIWMDPGMAFGTGNHETTRLCLERMTEWVDDLLKVGRPLDSVGVIDAGCGSGILALSAAALGLGAVEGFDLDPESVGISHENAELNGLKGRVEFYEGDLRTGLSAKRADLVLANILANVLMAEREVLVEAVAPGGRLVLSGILARECDDVRRCFESVAPDFGITSRVMGEWADLQLVRPG